MHPDTVSSWFPKFLQRYNKTINDDDTISKENKQRFLLPITNFKSLRHSAATLLINEGLNVRALSNRLGHANTSTTLNIYSHALQSADIAASDMMENIMSTKKKDNSKQKQA